MKTKATKTKSGNLKLTIEFSSKEESNLFISLINEVSVEQTMLGFGLNLPSIYEAAFVAGFGGTRHGEVNNALHSRKED